MKEKILEGLDSSIIKARLDDLIASKNRDAQDTSALYHKDLHAFQQKHFDNMADINKRYQLYSMLRILINYGEDFVNKNEHLNEIYDYLSEHFDFDEFFERFYDEEETDG